MGREAAQHTTAPEEIVNQRENRPVHQRRLEAFVPVEHERHKVDVRVTFPSLHVGNDARGVLDDLCDSGNKACHELARQRIRNGGETVGGQLGDVALQAQFLDL